MICQKIPFKLSLRKLVHHDMILNWILGRNIAHCGVKTLSCSSAIPLPIHEFIEVAWQLVLMASMLSFEFNLHSVPVRFSILYVYSSRSYKLDGLVDNIVAGDIWQGYDDTIVCSPFIRPQCCPRGHMLSNDWQ